MHWSSWATLGEWASTLCRRMAPKVAGMGQTWLIRPTLGANLTLPGVGQCSRFGLGQVDACCKLMAMMSGPVTPWCPAQLLKLGTHLPWSSSSSPRHAPNRNPRSSHWEPCHTRVVFTPCNSRNQQLSRSPSTGQGKQTAGPSHSVSSGPCGRTLQPRAVAWRETGNIHQLLSNLGKKLRKRGCWAETELRGSFSSLSVSPISEQYSHPNPEGMKKEAWVRHRGQVLKPSTGETEAGRSLCQGQPEIHRQTLVSKKANQTLRLLPLSASPRFLSRHRDWLI